MHELRDAAFVMQRERGHADASGVNLSEFLGLLRRAATAMSATFSTTTGTPCRITVKQIVEADDDQPLGVRDLTRSDPHRISRTRDLISANTDFLTLLQGEEHYFRCNDIQQLRDTSDYANSHATAGRPLPYQSTIVWPIRKVLDDPLLAEALGAFSDWQDLIGFLCVDSKEPQAFTDADVQTGAAMADTLYTVLRPFLLPREGL